MADEAALTNYVNSGEYLPDCLRDFHDAKDVFKTLHANVDLSKNNYCKDVTWDVAHCYVIDMFLWWMAKHGWTMQRSRKRIDFRDLDAVIKARKDAEAAAFRAYLDERRAAREAAANEEAIRVEQG